jgi:cytochrome P450
MAAAFRPADLHLLAPRVAQAVADRLDALDDAGALARGATDAGAGPGPGADSNANKTAFDFVAAVARPLPAQVIGMLLGIDDEPDFGFWSDELADFIGAPNPTIDEALRAQSALQSLAAHFDRCILDRRTRDPHIRARELDEHDLAGSDMREPLTLAPPGGTQASGSGATDLLGRLISAERDGRLRGSAEVLSQCAMLLFAGHETTRHLLANGLRHLLGDPHTLHRLRAEPDRIPDAVRELLRFDSPVQYSGRRVVADTVLHGQPLRRGDLVVALIGSANRDPARFYDPDRFDIDRRTGTSLAFGQGPHVCIGAALTLMEAKETLSQVFARWPDLRLDGAAPPAWTRNALYRGVTSLPLRVDRMQDANRRAPQHG